MRTTAGDGIGLATRAVTAGLLAVGLSMPLFGCGTGGTGATASGESTGGGSSDTTTEAVVKASLMSEDQIPTDGSPLSLVNAADLWTERDSDPSYEDRTVTHIKLSGGTASADGAASEAVSVSDSAVSIGKDGVYVLSGDGTLPIVVDASGDAKVQIVLSGTNIDIDGNACIYAKSADKLFVTVADGTNNRLRSTGAPTQRDGNTVDGAIFSKCDLTVNGKGTLDVVGEAMHGIVCKDDLRLMSGDVSVSSSQGHAIQAKDSIAVHGGDWKLAASEKDGIHAENAEDQTRGWAYVDGGTIDVKAGTDGFDASGTIQIDGGNLSIEAGDDGLHAEFDLAVNGGEVKVTKSSEGIEGGTVTVTAGTVDVKAEDDGINATGDPNKTDNKSDGELPGHDAPAQGHMGGKPQGQTEAASGNDRGRPMAAPDGEVPQPPQEGIPSEANDMQGQQPPAKPDGEAPQASDEGTPAHQTPPSGDGTMETSANRQGMRPDGMGGRMGMDVDESAIATVSGGKVLLETGGDGLDSNGTIHVTGGETYISGPVSDGNSAIDFGTDLRIDGGTLLAVGSAGMVEEPSESSKQSVVMTYLDEAVSGTVSLSETGATSPIATLSPTKGYASVIVSTPKMEQGKKYTLSTGESSQEVAISETITRIGERKQGMGAQGGVPNGDSLVGRQFGARQPSSEDTTSA